jgi:hypothetical protein
MVVNYTNLPKTHDIPLGGASSINDLSTVTYRDFLISQYSKSYFIPKNAEKIKNDFFKTYINWIFTSHKIKGFEKFNNACFTNGTRESFEYFYLKYLPIKRLRLAKGEYFFHQMMKSIYKDYVKFAWIEDDPLKTGDFLLISVPFSDTGNIPKDLDNILKTCNKLEIPVMLDLAYINLSKNLTFNIDYECVEYVTSSLSKVFPLEFHRVGIRLQKEVSDDQLYVVNEPYHNYINIFSAKLGLEMMKKFPPDYIFNKYRNKQLQFCSKLNLEPSDCVIFGIDHNNKFKHLNRGNNTTRLCFSKIWDRRIEYEL